VCNFYLPWHLHLAFFKLDALLAVNNIDARFFFNYFTFFFSCRTVTDATVSLICRYLTNLTLLSLHYTPKITDAGTAEAFSHATALTSLTRLTITENLQIVDKTLESIGKYCHNLQSLDLSNTSITSLGPLVMPGATMSSLRTLTLRRCRDIVNVDRLSSLIRTLPFYVRFTQLYACWIGSPWFFFRCPSSLTQICAI
jgi:hypothetical protein